LARPLFRAGVKPVNDNPHVALLGRTFADLPFKDNDEAPPPPRRRPPIDENGIRLPVPPLTPLRPRSLNRFTRRIDMAEKIDFTKPDAVEKLSERLTSGAATLEDAEDSRRLLRDYNIRRPHAPGMVELRERVRTLLGDDWEELDTEDKIEARLRQRRDGG
jgi:hypothetical protein